MVALINHLLTYLLTYIYCCFIFERREPLNNFFLLNFRIFNVLEKLLSHSDGDQHLTEQASRHHVPQAVLQSV